MEPVITKHVDEESLMDSYQREIRPYIDVIDNLRRLGVDQDVSLPNVVVVGDQSSGKSSIIEALSGIQLPRGTGIVTRFPLELQLKRVHTNDNAQWRAILKYKNEEKFTDDPQDVGPIVKAAQDEICGPGKDVRDERLTLCIEDPRPNAPDLTVIDLPGISRTPIAGQSENVCDTIREIVTKAVSPHNTVILCMIAANLDFAVNESVQIAKKADPKFERTIGVVTKPDLANEYQKQDMVQILDNLKYPLKKGFVIVKCRSQDEIRKNTSLEQSRINEKKYFDQDDYYQNIKYSQKGIPSLARKITEELGIVIKKSIPELKDKIKEKMNFTQTRLSNIPSIIPEVYVEKLVLLNKYIYDLCQLIHTYLLYGKKEETIPNAYRQWRIHFNKYLTDIEALRAKAFENRFGINNLKSIIEMYRGPELSCLINYELFRTEIQSYLKQYDALTFELADVINKKIEENLLDIIMEHFKHLPDVNGDFKKIIIDNSKSCLDECHKILESCLDQESIVFTMDTLFNKEFINHEGLTANQLRVKLTEYINVDSSINAEIFQKNLKIYLKLVNTRLADRIPLIILQNLLYKLEKNLNQQCLNYPNTIDVNEKLRENKQLVEDRKILVNKIERLKIAHDKLAYF